MRKCQREKIYISGPYMDVAIYPVFRKSTASRRIRSKPTSEVQQRLNERNSIKKLGRLINTNFTENDLKVELTYRDPFNPGCDADAFRDLNNFLRRIRYYRKVNNLDELKYVVTTEKGSKKGRYHHHLVINGGIDVKTLKDIWGKGIIKASPLIFNEHGVADLAAYMTKQQLSYRRYKASRNLKQPKMIERDGRLSTRKIKRLSTVDSANPVEWNKIYPGYQFIESRSFYNGHNNSTYLEAYFVKIPEDAYKKQYKRRSKKDG